jgi:hypothetical protein
VGVRAQPVPPDPVAAAVVETPVLAAAESAVEAETKPKRRTRRKATV